MARHYDPAEIPPAPDLRYELPLWAGGLALVAGLDEAGRGAWAGPVVAGAVILPAQPEIAGLLARVRDSKQMTPLQRAHWAAEIQRHAAAWAVGAAASEEIDQLGIVPATRLAMRRALEALALPAEHLLIDALRLPELDLPQTALIKGDARSLSIAAASVLAKTARDAWMARLAEEFPEYRFAGNKGYGTAAHWEALQRGGPCPAHRRSFAPVAWVLSRAAPGGR
jgi:ribonuclease HII